MLITSLLHLKAFIFAVASLRRKLERVSFQFDKMSLFFFNKSLQSWGVKTQLELCAVFSLITHHSSAVSSAVSSSGRLPIGAGLSARDAPPRAGGEGPQGPQPHQLTPPPTHRQARTADILPLLRQRQSEASQCKSEVWGCCGLQALGLHCFPRFGLFLYGALWRCWIVVGSCLVPSGADLVIMFI